MHNDTPLLIIAGTGVPGVLARTFYSHFNGLSSGPVRIEAIPSLGFGHIKDAVKELEERYFWDHRWDCVDIVGHSQGALLALAMAMDYPHYVRHAILLAGPLHGTLRAPPWTPLAGARCVSWHSRWTMQHLQLPQGPKIHSFYTTEDQFVRPWSSSHLAGAENVVVSPSSPKERQRDEEWLPARCGHVSLATNAKVLDRIEYLLFS